MQEDVLSVVRTFLQHVIRTINWTVHPHSGVPGLEQLGIWVRGI